LKREGFIPTHITWRKPWLPGSSRFQQAHAGVFLTPCAGEGEIASLLGNLLNCETWGYELFPYRAEKAAARMDKCHSAPW
jgi:hypothetical protein